MLSRELYGKTSDEIKISNVLKAMPTRVENTLVYYRVSLVGRRKNPRKRYYRHKYTTL